MKHVALNWYDLGLKLIKKKDKKTLKKIKTNESADPYRCCEEMFQLWLLNNYSASWNQLIVALKGINLYSLAFDIEAKLLPVKSVLTSKGTVIKVDNMHAYLLYVWYM